MSQFVHQNELGLPFQGGVQVKMGPLGSRETLQAIQQRHGLGLCVRVEIPNHHIRAPLLCLTGRQQHGIGFAHTGGIAKEDFQLAPPFLWRFTLDGFQKRLCFLSGFSHGCSSHVTKTIWYVLIGEFIRIMVL